MASVAMWRMCRVTNAGRGNLRLTTIKWIESPALSLLRRSSTTSTTTTSSLVAVTAAPASSSSSSSSSCWRLGECSSGSRVGRRWITTKASGDSNIELNETASSSASSSASSLLSSGTVRSMTTKDTPTADEPTTKPTTVNANHKAIAKFEEMKTGGATLDKLKAFVMSSIAQRERDPSKALISSTREVQLLITALLNYGMEKKNLSIMTWSLGELDRRRFTLGTSTHPNINRFILSHCSDPQTTAQDLAPTLIYAAKTKQIDRLFEFTKHFTQKPGWEKHSEEMRSVVDSLINSRDATNLVTFLSMTAVHQPSDNNNTHSKNNINTSTSKSRQDARPQHQQQQRQRHQQEQQQQRQRQQRREEQHQQHQQEEASEEKASSSSLKTKGYSNDQSDCT